MAYENTKARRMQRALAAVTGGATVSNAALMHDVDDEMLAKLSPAMDEYAAAMAAGSVRGVAVRLAAKYGIKSGVLYTTIDYSGLPRPHDAFTARLELALEDALASRRPLYAICAKYQVTEGILRRRLKEEGVTPRERRTIKRKNKRSLTERNDRVIKELRQLRQESGRGAVKAIAERYNMTTQRVSELDKLDLARQRMLADEAAIDQAAG
jgi:hypothetical protein